MRGCMSLQCILTLAHKAATALHILAGTGTWGGSWLEGISTLLLLFFLLRLFTSLCKNQ